MKTYRFGLVSALISLCFALGAMPAIADDLLSEPGAYSGYSEILYDDFGIDDESVKNYLLKSEYVTMRDGTKLAVDYFLPTRDGAFVEGENYPVVWQYTAYNRRYTGSGLTAKNYPGAALALVKYGYVVAAVDMRGSYASFGSGVTQRRIQWEDHAYWDSYDIIDWFADQPWSDGNIGMWGCSATGHSQWQAAATQHPNLKAIFPLSAPTDYYEIGGIVGIQNPPADPPAWPAAFSESEYDKSRSRR